MDKRGKGPEKGRVIKTGLKKTKVKIKGKTKERKWRIKWKKGGKKEENDKKIGKRAKEMKHSKENRI